MDPILTIDVISRVLHIGTAIVLVGGSTFTLLVLMPAAKELPDDEHDSFRERLTGKWKRFVHLGVLLMLVTGFYNFARAVPGHKGDSLYHALVGTKILLAFGVFFLGAALVGRSAKLEPIRQNRAKWLKVMVLLAATIVAISGFVKVRGNPATTGNVTAVSNE